MERVGRELNDELAWEPGAELAAPRHGVGERLQADDVPTRPALTGDRDWLDALNALCA